MPQTTVTLPPIGLTVPSVRIRARSEGETLYVALRRGTERVPPVTRRFEDGRCATPCAFAVPPGEYVLDYGGIFSRPQVQVLEIRDIDTDVVFRPRTWAFATGFTTLGFGELTAIVGGVVAFAGDVEDHPLCLFGSCPPNHSGDGLIAGGIAMLVVGEIAGVIGAVLAYQGHGRRPRVERINVTESHAASTLAAPHDVEPRMR